MQNRSTRPAALASPAPAAGLPVSPDNPGLWIRAAVDPRRPFGRLIEEPRAAFACRCGFVRSVSGHDRVLEFMTNYHKHAEVCPLKEVESARRVTHGAADTAGSTPEKAERPGRRTPDLSAESTSSAA